MKKIYVVGGNDDYASWIEGCCITEDIEDADIVMFTGGEDVTPEFYNEANVASYCNVKRDLYESSIFERAQEMGKNIIGICRGSQFLTVMSGGRLIQDVTNHATGALHPILVIDERVMMNATSTHHQMMYPFYMKEEDFKVIARSPKNISKHYKTGGGNLNLMPMESEIVYYPKTNALAIQPHPEMMDKDSHFIKYLNDLIEKIFI